MNSITLGIDAPTSPKECFDCPLSECNPQSKQCKAKGADKWLSSEYRANKRRNPRLLVDLDKLGSDPAWLKTAARVGPKTVTLVAEPDALRAHGIAKAPQIRGKVASVLITGDAAALVRRIVAEKPAPADYVPPSKREPDQTPKANPVTVPQPVIPPKVAWTEPEEIAAPIRREAAKQTRTDSILLTIGVILDGDERDLVWALWAIQRELDRRRA